MITRPFRHFFRYAKAIVGRVVNFYGLSPEPPSPLQAKPVAEGKWGTIKDSKRANLLSKVQDCTKEEIASLIEQGENCWEMRSSGMTLPEFRSTLGEQLRHVRRLEARSVNVHRRRLLTGVYLGAAALWILALGSDTARSVDDE